MIIAHLAIWANEERKKYYETYFGVTSNEKYTNELKTFESYFLSFDSGAKLETMRRPDVPANQNDTVDKQHTGIIHIAFGVCQLIK